MPGGSSDVRIGPGVDPFDALRGTRMPEWVRGSARLRQVLVQIRKRCPVDLAPVLGVSPFLMAKALGAGLTAEARMPASEERAERVRSLADALVGDTTIARVGEGAWGYEFDVQTRWAFYPSGSANIIVTFFVARGFAEAWAAGALPEGIGETEAAARFICDALVTPEGFFAYTTHSPKLIHNANLLGAGLVASVGRLAGDDRLIAAALCAARLSLAALGPSGSLRYGEGRGLEWVDNFHTAYCLDGLLLLWLATGDGEVRAAMEAITRFWAEHFFAADGAPAYYAGARSPYPYDIHSAASAVDIGARLGSWGFAVGDMPERVHEWTRANLIAPDGSTYYRLHAWFTDRRNFVRWGDAHWSMAEASLAMVAAGRRSPLEEALERSRHAGGRGVSATS
jgi:hypothetical protein